MTAWPELSHESNIFLAQKNYNEEEFFLPASSSIVEDNLTHGNGFDFVFFAPFLSVLILSFSLIYTVIYNWKIFSFQEKSLKENLNFQREALEKNLEAQQKSLKVQQDNLNRTIEIQQDNNRREVSFKQHQALFGYRQESDRILFDLKQKVINESYSVEDFYLRYWEFQRFVFLNWCNCVLGDQSYKVCLVSLKGSYLENSEIQGVSFREGFKKSIKGQDEQSMLFKQFFAEIFDGDGVTTAMNNIKDNSKINKLK